MLVLKISLNEWKNASRDQRELSVCRELGADVKVVAKGSVNGKRAFIDDVNGFEVHRLSTRPFPYLPVAVNRILSVFRWAAYVRKLSPEIISGHDLDGLTIGWLSGFLKKPSTRPRLVYDSHEFEAGRNAKRNKFQTKMIIYWERFMIKRSDLMVVVNESIANEVVKLHRLKERPVVVRNIPPKWEIDRKVCLEMRERMLGDLSGEYILIYHGAVVKGRGIEKCVEVLTYDKELSLVILGSVPVERYKSDLENLIEKRNVKDRVIFYDAVPACELWKYIGAADISMAIVEPVAKSYYLALPNKLFESIQAHTPVVGSDLPEIKKIILQYKVGEVCSADNIADIYRAVKDIKEDKKKQEQYRKNEEDVSGELCWEMEQRRLKEAYIKIYGSVYFNAT